MNAYKIAIEAIEAVNKSEINGREFEERIAPLRDVESVIRCKDCYYFIPPKDRDIRTLYSCRETWSKHIIMGENDFCSRAIRKDDVYMRREKDGEQE